LFLNCCFCQGNDEAEEILHGCRLKIVNEEKISREVQDFAFSPLYNKNEKKDE